MSQSKQKPLPAERAVLDLEMVVDGQAWQELQKGFTPQSEQDKWVITSQENTLFFGRSSSGSCIFEAHFAPLENGEYQLTAAYANRHPAEYRNQDGDYDSRLLIYLIRRLLLNHPVPFPQPAALPHQNKTTHEKHVMGGGEDRPGSFIPLNLLD